MSEPAVDPKEPADDAPDVEPAVKEDPIFDKSGPTDDQKPSGEPISIAAPPSRRNWTRERFDKLEQAQREREDVVRKDLSQRDAQIAQLTGSLQAVQQMLQAQATASAAPAARKEPEVDPDDLERKALEALDNKDVNGFMRLHRESILARVPKPKEAPAPQQQPQQMHPAIMALQMQHPDVALAGEAGMEWVNIKDRELHLMGVPPGPARVKKAFEEAAKVLKAQSNAQTQSPRYSQESATVLSAVPTSRGQAAGGNRTPGVRLSAYEKGVAKQVGMTEDEYARHMAVTHPERVEK